MHIKSVLRNQSQISVSHICTFPFYYIQALGAETELNKVQIKRQSAFCLLNQINCVCPILILSVSLICFFAT